MINPGMSEGRKGTPQKLSNKKKLELEPSLFHLASFSTRWKNPRGVA